MTTGKIALGQLSHMKGHEFHDGGRLKPGRVTHNPIIRIIRGHIIRGIWGQESGDTILMSLTIE